MKLVKYQSPNCLACGALATSNGFCYVCNKYIKVNNLSTKNLQDCLNKLKQYHETRNISTCIFCGEPVKALYYCAKHYAYLYRLKVNMRDRNKCLELLKQRHLRGKGAYNKCLFCGRLTRYKHFCVNHRRILKIRNMNLKNVNDCLNELRKWSVSNDNKKKI